MNKNEIKHLYWRAGFGIKPSQLEELDGKSRKKIVAGLFENSSEYSPIQLGKEWEMEDYDRKKMSKAKRKELKKKHRLKLVNVNNEWLTRMSFGKDFLREKMTFFWHDHFPSSFIFVKPIVLQNNTLRQHALGNFRELLHAIAKDPLMLVYLNNQENKKNAPNENFAREVMELFTLGEGHYTENDIKEAARAFTGWQTNLSLDFKFRTELHDSGTKTIFGKTGKFGGEDVINMILENKQTARYIAEKLYKFFVNEQGDAEKVEHLATIFYDNDYEIQPVLEEIFLSDWFYDAQHIGSKIKSPIELLAGLNKSFDLEFPDVKAHILAQKILGQILLKPPNVAGWPSGRAWIDSSSLLYRMKLPQLFLLGKEIPIKAKEEFDAAEKGLFGKYSKKDKVITRVNWEDATAYFAQFSREERIQEMAEVYWNVNLPVAIAKGLTNKFSTLNDEEFLKLGTLALLGMPEYQTC
ncbi:MAG: DUF1800 domain-containing protein [Saprospiraceae bacterium]|nr:DUF1800 domain-containing protein [Saprospiraceae bacterium]